MATTDLSTLPLEVINSITPYLTRHDLTVCVLANHQWFNIFSPTLWRSITFVDSNDSSYIVNLPKIMWFRLFQKSVEAGALHRNGHWIRTVDAEFCTMVNSLTNPDLGGEECAGLLEVKIGNNRDPERWMNPAPGVLPSTRTMTAAAMVNLNKAHVDNVVALLRRNRERLRKVVFVLDLLRIDLQDSDRLIQAVPSGVEDLSVVNWYSSLPASSISSSSESVPLGLRTLSIANTDVDSLLPILRRSPNLEKLVLKDMLYLATERPPWQSLASTIRTYCPRLHSLLLIDGPPYSDGEFAALIDSSTCGWKTLGFPHSGVDSSTHEFGPLSTAALLKHCSTLENLRLEGCGNLPSWAIQQLFCTAPRLRRFDAISKERYHNSNVQLDACDMLTSHSSSSDWVCLSLESLKLQITGVPRPDLVKRTNGQPLTGPLHIIGLATTAEMAQRVQRHIYTQLGRLTRLKVLVLGHEVEHDAGVYREEEGRPANPHPFGQPNEKKPKYQSGYQYGCLDMTLGSGLSEMRGLRELRWVETGAMAVGRAGVEAKEEENVGWCREHWPLVELDGEGEENDHGRKKYEDRFWTAFGYADYY
ncbi:hypothetical protein BGX29_000378 [Mortierella sp. GBA35]|nr:hypothetical protein BGX29_000378 [Mortierella sp. GBA35]